MRSAHRFSFMLVLALASCQATQETSEATASETPKIVVTSARLEVTNPSIAPDHRVDREWELPASAEGFDAAVTKLLEQTRINEQVSVAAYIRMVAADQRLKIARVRASDPPRPDRGEGGSVAVLSLVTAEYGVFDVPADAGYSTSAVSELRELIVAKGRLSETDYGNLELSPGPR